MPLFLTTLIAGMITLLDQVSKQLLKEADSTLIPGLISLSGARNTGAAFSLLSGQTWLLPLLSGVLTAGILAYIIKARPRGLPGMGLALMLGGAIGNLIDRVLLGYVIDFIRLDFISFPIFNLADIAVVVGSLCLATAILLTKEEPHA